MPDIQQQWLEEQLDGFGRHVGHPSGWYIPDVVEIILSAWPSSPQGLAAKQMVEALEPIANAIFDDLGYDSDRRQIVTFTDERVRAIKAAVKAARKAGVR